MFHSVLPENYQENPFSIKNTWALVAATHEGKTNALTVSWGFVGYIWEHYAALINVRPQRHTQSILHEAGHFSVSIFDDSYKKMMGYMGSASGAQEDKIAKSGLTLTHKHGAPVFEEARLVLICKTLYTDRYKELAFRDPQLPARIYPQQDYHHFYIGEVIEILSK